MQDQSPIPTLDPAPTEPPVAPAAGAISSVPPGAPPDAVSVPVAPVTVVARRGRGARLLNYALAGALVLAIAGVAFAVGRFTAPASANAGGFPNGGGFFRNGNGGGAVDGQGGGQNGRGAFFGGGATIEGTVDSVTATTLTLKTASGQTIQIALDGSTTYHAQTDASASDVSAGGKVLVRLNLRGAGGGANGGPAASGAPFSPTASDVTVEP